MTCRLRWFLVISMLALVLLPFWAEWSGSTHVTKLVTRILIMGLAALGLDLALGVGGLVSFGHSAFLGIGGYTAGVAFQHSFNGVPFLGLPAINDCLLLLPLSMVFAAVLALLAGAVSLRCKGVAFIMITLAFAQMLYFLMVSLRFYNGQDGIALWQRSNFIGTDWLEDTEFFYFLALICLCACFWSAWRFVHSPAGLLLRAAAQSSHRLQALGGASYRIQLTAYCVSGAITGLAGFLLANSGYFVSPSFMSWQHSGHLIIMVVLGGMGTLIGPIIGAFVFILMEEWLPFLIELIATDLGQHWRVVFGPILVFIALYARGGLAGWLVGRTHSH